VRLALSDAVVLELAAVYEPLAQQSMALARLLEMEGEY
jgi:hypothetical protein